MMPSSDYLNLIQSVIGRMASNAFLVKGWSITLTAALIALGGSLSSLEGFNEYLFFSVNITCLLAFLWLDGYFYYNEKKYREIYDYARDTSRFKSEHLYDLNANLLTPEVDDNNFKIRINVIKSSAVYPLYLLQFILTCIIYLGVL